MMPQVTDYPALGLPNVFSSQGIGAGMIGFNSRSIRFKHNPDDQAMLSSDSSRNKDQRVSLLVIKQDYLPRISALTTAFIEKSGSRPNVPEIYALLFRNKERTLDWFNSWLRETSADKDIVNAEGYEWLKGILTDEVMTRDQFCEALGINPRRKAGGKMSDEEKRQRIKQRICLGFTGNVFLGMRKLVTVGLEMYF